MTRMPTYSLGIDIGGTFTDIVVYSHDSGRSLSHKELTTPSAPHRGVVTGVQRLFAREGIAPASVGRVVHATTLFTNALIERKGARTGLITTAGFRDTLEMAREKKYELYDLHIELPQPLVPRHLRLEVDERCDAGGRMLVPLKEDELLSRVAELVAADVQSIAIVFLHAYANPENERRARECIQRAYPGLFVSISSEVSPQIREFERSVTTVANAYVKPLADGYLDLMTGELKEMGIRAPLFMMLSSGGLTHVDEAKRVPIQLLESGPAAGALAGAFFGERAQTRDVLAFDMGGTTAKLAIIKDGQPMLAHEFEASREKRLTEGSGLPISISTIELIEIGAGGGSIAHMDALGLVKVGPHSAASDPGPACYGRGGASATVTDANLVLGYLDPDTFAGGTIALDVAQAEASMAAMASKAGVSIPEFAWGVHSIVNENMAGAARVHVAERGHNAGQFSMLLTGGGGPLHGCEVARRLGTTKVICPPGAGVASALGLLMAPARVDRMATVAQAMKTLDWEALEATFEALSADALGVIRATLPETDGKPTQADIVRTAEIRFVGQGFEVSTPLPQGPYTSASAAPIRAAFESAYLRTFAQVPPMSDIELVNIRVAATATASTTTLDAAVAPVEDGPAYLGKRRAWVGAYRRYEEVAVYRRDLLHIGAQIAGPALVQEESSTLVLPAGSQAQVEASGNLIVQLASPAAAGQKGVKADALSVAD